MSRQGKRQRGGQADRAAAFAQTVGGVTLHHETRSVMCVSAKTPSWNGDVAPPINKNDRAVLPTPTRSTVTIPRPRERRECRASLSRIYFPLSIQHPFRNSVPNYCAMPSSLEPVTLYPIFTRVCLRCQRPVNGYGYYTLYGCIIITHNGSSKKVHGSGEAVHHRCPESSAPRAVPHDGGMEGISEYTRHTRNVEQGIDYNARTGRYAARVGKKRLGTHATPELAEQARQEYIDSATAHRHYRKSKKRDRKERRANAN